ncbi:MAG: hypothetical protein QXF82_07585 [Nitrososphaeria archaeon]
MLEKALRGEYGVLYTSDYIFDETVTLTRIRTRSIKAALLVGGSILGSRVRVLRVERYLGNILSNIRTGILASQIV